MLSQTTAMPAKQTKTDMKLKTEKYSKNYQKMNLLQQTYEWANWLVRRLSSHTHQLSAADNVVQREAPFQGDQG